MDKTDCGNFIYLYSHSIFGTFDLLRVALLKTHALAHFLSRAARAPKPSVHSGFPWARYERMFPGEWEIESPQACAPLQKEPLKRVRQSSGWNKVELPGQQIHPHLPPLTDPYSCFRWRVVTLTNIHLWYRGGIFMRRSPDYPCSIIVLPLISYLALAPLRDSLSQGVAFFLRCASNCSKGSEPIPPNTCVLSSHAWQSRYSLETCCTGGERTPTSP